MPSPLQIGRPLPRAADACTEFEKWRRWILAERGHGPEWATVFRVGAEHVEAIWLAIAQAVQDAPVATIRDRGGRGVVCGVRVRLTLNGRTGSVLTAWHYADRAAAPRLVTAYPAL